HISPVGIIHVTKDLVAFFQHTREGLTLNRNHAVFWDGGNQVFFKDVAASINLIGRRIFSLFQKLQHSAIVISWHAAKGTWVTHTSLLWWVSRMPPRSIPDKMSPLKTMTVSWRRWS